MIFEKLAKIPVEVEIASEFRYRNPMLNPDTLVITISQSGETADTLAAMREAHRNGCKVLAITNVVGSAISREADYVFYLWAGPEIAVASTKAYTTMLLAQYLLGVYFAQVRNTISGSQAEQLLTDLEQIPYYTEQILTLENTKKIEEISSQYKNVENCFFIGRGADWSIAMEGSLKLKEISYIHAEAYAAGELKHGTLALITKDTPVFALNLQSATYEKTLSNIKEVIARDAEVIAVVKEDDIETVQIAHDFITLPALNDFIMPVLAVIPLQLLAYYIAKARGCSIDQPRNLAKSVTVE